MHPVVCHMKDMQWDSLCNNNSEKDKIGIIMSTFVFLAVGGNATCFDPILGSPSGSILCFFGFLY
jgi:hypothetical protein